MKEPVQTLEQWLTIATDRLAPRAKERIRLEIESHFADAVEAYQADGMGEAKANACALTSLGNAKRAAGHFRKYHLSEADISKFKNRWISYISAIAFFIFFGGLEYQRHSDYVVTFGILFVMLAAINGWLSDRESPPFRLIIALDFLFFITVITFFVGFGFWPEWGPGFVPSISIFYFGQAMSILALWRKDRNHRVFSEMPSCSKAKNPVENS